MTRTADPPRLRDAYKKTQAVHSLSCLHLTTITTTMSRYENRYDDPYDRPIAYPPPEQYQQPAYAQDDPNAYHDGAYGEAPRYPSYPADPSAGDYEAYPSTEKINDGGYAENTAREQPGRSGVRGQTKSFASLGPPPRSTGILRMWRKDERGEQWFRGGGLRATLRIFGCCLTITIIMLVSIVLAIALYVRPPNVTLQSVNLGNSPVTLTTDGLTVSFNVTISAANPNWFSVDFNEIKATAFYPGNNTNSFGGGTLYNVDFQGYNQYTFDFPFTLNYTTAADPNRVVLNDLISKCGILSGVKSDITVDYDLLLKLKVLGVSISPTVSGSASFECPITESDLEGIIGSGL
ncbi:hypothetical protein BCR39DRAFT_514697 [Naematelia encephala]|uniref:Late embryogenesis abundant protein LEA-2 subgroup domain-containing protein n=1 Tax=Naematelia encephala TaxID=71784 RepID=A0A1Y2BJ22_9TREE|nr:hypothetical protein BCR39DRAFT_514697 [Naematelia encephala]